jgi:hypothetical protein
MHPYQKQTHSQRLIKHQRFKCRQSIRHTTSHTQHVPREYSQSDDPLHPRHPPLSAISPVPRTPYLSLRCRLTHALLVQAIELQALGGGRARGPRPGNPLNSIEGMDEDAVWRESHVSIRDCKEEVQVSRTYRVRHGAIRSPVPVMEAGIIGLTS